MSDKDDKLFTEEPEKTEFLVELAKNEDLVILKVLRFHKKEG
jgi:hypothetical protein